MIDTTKITRRLALPLTLLLVGGCAQSTSKSYVRAGYDFAMMGEVAVVDVVGEIHGEAAKNQIADLFSMQLLRKGFSPIQREHVMRLLGESGFRRGELSPEAYAIEAGRVLQVPAVLIVTVPTFGLEPSLTAKIIEVQNGSALWMGSGTTGDPDAAWYSTQGNQFEEHFGGSIFANPDMARNRGDQEVAGKPLDTALTAAEINQFDAIVTDICKEIPYRSSNGKPVNESNWWPW